VSVEGQGGQCGGDKSVCGVGQIQQYAVSTVRCVGRKTNKQFGISKAAMITKNEMISINELNYKAPEKSHNTEE